MQTNISYKLAIILLHIKMFNYYYKNYSLAIEPIYPQVCQRVSIMQQPNNIDAPISPVGLSELLNSLPCCLSLKRQDPLPVYHLIMEVNYF